MLKLWKGRKKKPHFNMLNTHTHEGSQSEAEADVFRVQRITFLASSGSFQTVFLNIESFLRNAFM